MEVTAKALRSRIGAILACLDRGETVTITYRGKPRARLVGIAQTHEPASRGAGLEEAVRTARKLIDPDRLATWKAPRHREAARSRV